MRFLHDRRHWTGWAAALALLLLSTGALAFEIGGGSASGAGSGGRYGAASGFVRPAETGAANLQAGKQIKVHYIDVDQGAAALIELPAPCGAILIDAGGYGQPAEEHLIAYLKAFFERRPDLGNRLAAIYITHNHLDHNTSLPRIVRTFGVGRYIETGRPNGRVTTWMDTRLTQVPRIEHLVVTDAMVAAAGTRGLSNPRVDPLNCAPVNPRIRILSGARVPGAGLTKTQLKTENNHSLTIRIDFGDSSFLWTGDMETPALKQLEARFGKSKLLDVGVLLVGHHGADNGVTKPFLDAVTPELAVISVGHLGTVAGKTAFGYGHPRFETLELLSAIIAARRPPVIAFMARGEQLFEPYSPAQAIYATGWDGDVTVVADDAGHYSVRLGE